MDHVLLIDDDRVVIPAQVRQAFAGNGYRVTTKATGAEGVDVVRRDPPGVILLDLRLPDTDGLEVFRRVKELDARIPVIFVTMAKTANTAIEAMKRGAFNYLYKPLDLCVLQSVVGDALDVSRRMRTEVVLAESSPEDDAPEVDAIFGACPEMLETYKAIGRVAAQDVPVLITGESGTGKELVARAIYQHSARSKAAFFALNCAAIPENLLESELFGHEKGAFTGADRRRIGKFEQCHGGTLLLDEIGDMPPALQAKLLRVLQEKTFERVGGNETIRADVRIIASTHRDLKARAADERFRADLYYRLGVFTIHLPSLRERGDDLDLLATHYARRFSAELGRDILRVAPEAMARLRAHSWPGNIRELQSVVKQALLKASGMELLPSFLPDLHEPPPRSASRPPPVVAAQPNVAEARGIDAVIERGIAETSGDINAEVHRLVDRYVFAQVLAHTRGNRRDAALLLGISRQTMRSRLRALGMQTALAGESAEPGDAGEEDENP